MEMEVQSTLAMYHIRSRKAHSLLATVALNGMGAQIGIDAVGNKHHNISQPMVRLRCSCSDVKLLT